MKQFLCMTVATVGLSLAAGFGPQTAQYRAIPEPGNALRIVSNDLKFDAKNNRYPQLRLQLAGKNGWYHLPLDGKSCELTATIAIRWEKHPVTATGKTPGTIVARHMEIALDTGDGFQPAGGFRIPLDLSRMPVGKWTRVEAVYPLPERWKDRPVKAVQIREDRVLQVFAENGPAGDMPPFTLEVSQVSLRAGGRKLGPDPDCEEPELWYPGGGKKLSRPKKPLTLPPKSPRPFATRCSKPGSTGPDR